MARLVSPDPKVYGYLRRFMVELEAGFLIGCASKPLQDEVVNLMQEALTEGYLIVSDATSESGFAIPYFSRKASKLVDFDGVTLVKKLLESD